MLYTQKLLAELEDKREQFVGYQDRYGKQLDAYQAALDGLGARFATAASLDHALVALQSTAGAGRVALGARPTAEYDGWRARGGQGAPTTPFTQVFAHHGEAREWAERLHGTTTFAVDGSQLMPWRDASIPVALVQAGLYENPHQPPTPYVKDIVTAILTPDDLLGGEPDAAPGAPVEEAFGYSERVVHLRRFELEMRTLIARIRHHASQTPGQGQPRAVALYDGSLMVSFALKMAPAYRDRYVGLARDLLRASEECGVPVIGYIDTSFARDVVTMARALSITDADPLGLPEPRGIHDALLWRGRLGWGDRTPAFLTARDDLARMGYDDQHGAVAFTYFQAALDRPPARIEVPRWVVEAGRLDEVMDIVRAETIVGNGYPYPLEAADAVAVISIQDRAQFYTLFQEFAERAGLPFTFSRKALSKSRRRV